MNDQFDKHEELDWLAFRYISNEMNEAELAAFEERLEQDHAACEAVARAVNASDGGARDRHHLAGRAGRVRDLQGVRTQLPVHCKRSRQTARKCACRPESNGVVSIASVNGDTSH